jgi:hypothetical protein
VSHGGTLFRVREIKGLAGCVRGLLRGWAKLSAKAHRSYAAGHQSYGRFCGYVGIASDDGSACAEAGGTGQPTATSYDRKVREITHTTACWGNPVKHGLVERAVDWPYPSIHRDIRSWRVSPEWAATVPDGDFGE